MKLWGTSPNPFCWYNSDCTTLTMSDREQKKRKRAVQIIVRVTPEEKAEILKNMESVGISNLSVYARKMMLDGQVIHADFTEIKELSRQLGYLARNINQIALRANETRNLYKSDVEDLQRDCDPQTAYFDFELTNTMARTIKGDYSRGGCNIAHHIVQSFAPYDKITPEQAHAIGKEFADRFLQGRYEYVIATHVDKGHIHNHIIFNAVSFYDYKKFRNYKVAAKAREISDRLSVENGLYVPQFKRQKAVKHHEWSQRKNGTSWVAQLEEILNKAVTQAHNFSEFCELVRSMVII